MMNMKSIAVAAVAAFTTLGLAGCETLDAYTQESKTSSTAKGAMIGAAAGAVAGLVSGDDAVERRQRAMILAGVGALAGGAVGKIGEHTSELQSRENLVCRLL